MGFLSKLLGLQQAKPKPQKREPARKNGNFLKPWPAKPQTKILELPGGYDRTLYVYDDSPFSTAKRGDTIQVEFFPGEATLLSKKSGSAVDTHKDAAVCLLHKGRPVGVVFDYRNDVRLAYDKGIRLLATATVGRQLPDYGNIRALTLHLPTSRSTTRQLIENYEVNSKVPKSAQRIQFNEWDEQDFEQLTGRSSWAFENARLEFLPVPKGSSAKPHILASSAEGRKVFRLTARNSVYKDVASAIESSAEFLILAERRTAGDGRVGYNITLAHW